METPNTEAIGPDQITAVDMERAVEWLENLRQVSGTFQQKCMMDLSLIGATVMVASNLTPEQFVEQVKETYAAILPLISRVEAPSFNEVAEITEAMKSPEIKKHTLDPASAWPFPTRAKDDSEKWPFLKSGRTEAA